MRSWAGEEGSSSFLKKRSKNFYYFRVRTVAVLAGAGASEDMLAFLRMIAPIDPIVGISHAVTPR
jgi:hypothetical protein